MTETSQSDTVNAEKVQYGQQPAEQQAEPDKPSVSAKGSVFDYPKKKRVVTVILVGETGSGKTSFLSLLLNLFQGNGPFELKAQHYGETESGLDKTQSQTTEARLYTFDTTDGVKFQILDTPGLADTRGIDEDKKHRERIYRAVNELVTRIDGVMIVANGSIERLTAATSYTLETLSTLFPRSIKNNIGILFTNVGVDETGLNFQMASLPPGLQTPEYWCIDNPFSLYKRYLDTAGRAQGSGNRKLKQEKKLKENYDETVESLDTWLRWLDEREAIPTTEITELYHKSTEIESRLFGTTLFMENLSRLQRELQDLIRDIEAVKKCTLELGDSEELGGWCKVFKTFGIPNRLIPFKSDSTVKCSKCNHEASEHRNFKMLYEERPSKIYQAVLHNLQDTKTSEENLSQTTNQIEKEIENIEHNIEESKSEILRLVDEMNNLSLSPNYAGYIRSAMQLFELRKKQLESQPDSDGELSVIDQGIMAFKDRLEMLKSTAANRVVVVSSELVTYNKQAIHGPPEKTSELVAAITRHVFQSRT
ncbi:unnamed protein product [Rhizoctonia solani]|uniref:AAA+ ATPase domain-containing protein n=1 Tax=Rhizoctonia solani TaxID=456999 RepID=A0A8H3B4H9_9AGAM|nr:unnamed protein product [Rhizoctonia solani]